MSDSPTAAQLLADAAWLKRLATTLARDEADADDLVQESWIAARVAAVQPGSPAARAGVLPGDLVVSVDGVSVEQLGPEPVLALIGARQRGSPVSIGFERDGGRFIRALGVETPEP